MPIAHGSPIKKAPKGHNIPTWGTALWKKPRRGIIYRHGAGPYAKKKVPPCVHGGTQKKAAAYSPTWCSSTIGADGLNFPVRNGKGWAPSPWPPKNVYILNVRANGVRPGCGT